MEPTLTQRAAGFAKQAHSHQKRKYTGEPYFNHLVEVAITLEWAGCDEEMVAAGFLHDSIEDCQVSASTLNFLFGDRVAQLVTEVTDVSKPEDGNRAFRKKLDAQHLATASPDGMTIKLADILSNTRNILEHDQKFAEVYLQEKKALLPLLRRGNNTLWQLANDFVQGATNA